MVPSAVRHREAVLCSVLRNQDTTHQNHRASVSWGLSGLWRRSRGGVPISLADTDGPHFWRWLNTIATRRHRTNYREHLWLRKVLLGDAKGFKSQCPPQGMEDDRTAQVSPIFHTQTASCWRLEIVCRRVCMTKYIIYVVNSDGFPPQLQI